MLLFSDLHESRTQNIIISKGELDNYIDIVGNKLQKPEYVLVVYFQQYNILDRDTVEDIRTATSMSKLQTICSKYDMSMDVMKEVKKLLNKVELRALPMYQSDEERRAILSKQISVEDVTLDLETDRGRNQVAKKFSPMVMACANRHRGQGLDFDALISAGMTGLSKAINDYHKPKDFIDADKTITPADKEKLKKAKVGSFSGYAYTRIEQQILNDLNDYSRTVRINQYQFNKNRESGNTKGNFNTISIDVNRDSEDGNTSMLDRMTELASRPDVDRPSYTDSHWKKIFQIIDKKFSTKTASTFYRVFGLHGFDKCKLKDIAKEDNTSISTISMRVKEVIKYLKSDKRSMSILSEIMDIYSESLVVDNFRKSREQILEAFASDDIYLLLSEITRWTNKQLLTNQIGNALESFSEPDREFIISCLENDFNYLDESYTSRKRLLVEFLECMYPTESLKRKTDIYILNKMLDITEAFKNHYANILDQ